MIINAGVFTFIAIIVLIVCACHIRDFDNDTFVGCLIVIFPLLAVSLICFCNPQKCNIAISNIIQIKSSSSQIDKKVTELEQKYNALLKMKFDEAK